MITKNLYYGTLDGTHNVAYNLHHLNNGFYIDIDECAEDDHNCDDVCLNTMGSFSCGCRKGFSLDDDGISCTGNAVSGANIFCLLA